MKRMIVIGIISIFIYTYSWSAGVMLKTNEIDEASGIVAGRVNKDFLYTHNDSGGKPIVYILNKQGEKIGELLLKGIKNRDWEEIAIGKGPDDHFTYLYVGEIGRK